MKIFETKFLHARFSNALGAEWNDGKRNIMKERRCREIVTQRFKDLGQISVSKCCWRGWKAQIMNRGLVRAVRLGGSRPLDWLILGLWTVHIGN